MKFTGKNAIVTGGTKGIGYAVVEMLASQGATVVVAARTQSDGDKLVAAAKEKGWNVEFVKTDMSVEQDIYNLYDYYNGKYDHLEYFVNCAGVADTELKLFEEVTKELWDYTLAVELTGAFLAMQGAGRIMEQQQFGRIINITSMAGMSNGNFKYKMVNPAYACAKGAVNTLVKTFSRDLARFGTTVNAIAPAWIESERLAQLPDYEERAQLLPVRHFGKPEDIAACVEWLCGDNSGFITGQVVDINGGGLFHY